MYTVFVRACAHCSVCVESSKISDHPKVYKKKDYLKKDNFKYVFPSFFPPPVAIQREHIPELRAPEQLAVSDLVYSEE